MTTMLRVGSLQVQEKNMVHPRRGPEHYNFVSTSGCSQWYIFSREGRKRTIEQITGVPLPTSTSKGLSPASPPINKKTGPSGFFQ